MTARNHTGWTIINVAVLQVDVHADCKHRVRDLGGPLGARWQRHMWAGINVPDAAAVFRRMRCAILPGGIGNDMTVFTKQRFNDIEDAVMRNGPLAGSAAIEHLVAKFRIILE